MNLATFVPNPAHDPGEIDADPFDNLFLALTSEGKTRVIISSKMLKNSSTGAHHGQVRTGDLSRAGRFRKRA